MFQIKSDEMENRRVTWMTQVTHNIALVATDLVSLPKYYEFHNLHYIPFT
jgi:hypothetical protein